MIKVIEVEHDGKLECLGCGINADLTQYIVTYRGNDHRDEIYCPDCIEEVYDEIGEEEE